MNVSEIILQSVGKGEENAVHLSELVKLTQLSERDTRRAIETLRIKGLLICSNECGYFKPNTPDELRRYVRQEQARLRSIYRRTAPARKSLKKWEEQAVFDGASLLDIPEVKNE